MNFSSFISDINDIFLDILKIIRNVLFNNIKNSPFVINELITSNEL